MENNLINTGVQWLPSIPSNWKLTRVNKLFYLAKDKVSDPNPTVLSLARDGVKVRDISNNEGQLAESYDNYSRVIPGDLLLNPMDLQSGANCNMSEISGIISPAYLKLRALNDDVNPKFFDYYFKTQYWTMAMFAHGKGVSFDHRWTLNADTLLHYEVPFPPRKEQDAIVNKLKRALSLADSLIGNEKSQIERLKEYRRSLIGEIVTKGLNKCAKMKNSGVEWIEKIPEAWKVYPLKSMFSFGKGLPITKENLVPTGEKVISYGQLHAKYNISISLVPEMFRYVSNSYLQSNPECIVNRGDFIMADTSEDREGTCDFVRINSSDLIFAGYHSIILRANNPLYSEYFAYLFLSDYWRDQFRRRVGGVKLFSLTKKMLSTGSVILPPEEDLYEIVTYLNSITLPISQVIDKKTSQIGCLEDYKKSLIYEYVMGKRRG